MNSSADTLEKDQLEQNNAGTVDEHVSEGLKVLLDSLTFQGDLQRKPTTNSRLFKRAKTEKLCYHIVSDVLSFTVSVVLGFLLTTVLKNTFVTELPKMAVSTAIGLYPIMFAIPMLLVIISCRQKGHYSRFKGFWEELGEFLQISATIVGLTIAYFFFIKSDFSRLWLVTSWASIVTLVPLARWAVKQYLIKQGRWFTPTVVIGSGKNALESALAIESNILMGFEVVSLIEIGTLKKLQNRNTSKTIRDEIRLIDKTYPLLCVADNFENHFQDLGSPYVVLALEAEDYIKHEKVLENLAANHNNMSIIPPLRGLPLMGTEISPIFRHEVLHLRIRNNLANRVPRVIKRGFDIVVSSFLLVALLPLFLVLIAKIGVDGGSPFFFQTRIGKGRKLFKCWKFRSMYLDADQRLRSVLNTDSVKRAEYETTEKLKDDPRVTKIGLFIRKASIDELPQLWNVLKGDMSLVGPRPVREDELERYGPQKRYYLETPPGITGLWQISGRNDLEYSTRVSLDTWYVRNWSLWYDITILMKTIRVVLSQNGAY